MKINLLKQGAIQNRSNYLPKRRKSFSYKTRKRAFLKKCFTIQKWLAKPKIKQKKNLYRRAAIKNLTKRQELVTVKNN